MAIDSADKSHPRHEKGVLRPLRRLPVFLKFCISGALSALFSWLVIQVLISWHTSIALAGAMAYLAGIPVGFTLQRLFAFESRNSAWHDGPRFIAVSLCSATLSGYLVDVAATQLALPLWIAIGMATAVVIPANFVVMRLWVFAHSKHPHHSHSPH